jgi:hypothetical protein
LVCVPSAFASIVFEDSFDGTSLDLTKWTILDGASGISVGGGLLTIVGGPDHKRINTNALFLPPAGGSITASTRVYIGLVDYQKFGFNVNSIEFPGPTSGFYFDTLETPNTITAIIWPVPGTRVAQQIPLPWGAWYDLAVRWTASDVTFLINDVVAAQFPYAWSSALPVGVWNDRPGTMQADWVRVEAAGALDTDGDGITDDSDGCPDSIVTPSVVIGGCDSGAPNNVDANGCTLADQVQVCLAGARNHGQFVSCVVHLTQDERIRRCAARSALP